MNKLDNLITKYPNIFQPSDFTRSRYGGTFYFECENGWYDILDQMFSILEPIAELENSSRDETDRISVAQIKEKFGILRIYIDGIYEINEAQQAVDAAEKASKIVCELCGGPGKLFPKGWMKTHCDACHQNWFETK